MVDAVVYIEFVNLILAVILFVWNMIIFFSTKDTWRWIKLCYAINALILAIAFSAILLGARVSVISQLLINTLLLVTMLGGTSVSWVKKRYLVNLGKLLQTKFEKSLE